MPPVPRRRYWPYCRRCRAWLMVTPLSVSVTLSLTVTTPSVRVAPLSIVLLPVTAMVPPVGPPVLATVPSLMVPPVIVDGHRRTASASGHSSRSRVTLAGIRHAGVAADRTEPAISTVPRFVTVPVRDRDVVEGDQRPPPSTATVAPSVMVKVPWSSSARPGDRNQCRRAAICPLIAAISEGRR